MQRAVNQTPFGINAGIEYLLMAVLGGAGPRGRRDPGRRASSRCSRTSCSASCRSCSAAKGNYEMIVFGALLVLLLQTAREGLWPRLAALIPERAPSRRARPRPSRCRARAMPLAGEPLLSLQIGAQGRSAGWSPSTTSASTCAPARSSA